MVGPADVEAADELGIRGPDPVLMRGAVVATGRATCRRAIPALWDYTYAGTRSPLSY